MKTGAYRTAALMIVLSMFLPVVLTACSLFSNAEDTARNLAVDTALAFFTFDYQHSDQWMETVSDRDYYQTIIHSQVAPELIPFLQKYFIISTAELVSVEEVARGVSEADEADVVIWEIHLTVNSAWPGKKPPTPLDKAPYSIPWTGTDGTEVHAVGMYKLGVWSVKLISPDQVEVISDKLAVGDAASTE